MAEPGDATPPVLKELTGRIGKYEIVRLLGKGAMGHVYLAHDTVLDRDVALKVMAAHIADDLELKRRFEREARAVARMPLHPNVAAVFDMGTHSDGSPYFAMEYLDGHDLQKTVRQPPPLSLERKVAVILQVLAGLAHAHKAGLVHRDVKPANIFILKDGSAKVTDFGVVREAGHSMTGTGNIVGTADYMSPEQVKGEKVDGRSDLFSVGCMLFELAAGRRPFHSDNLMAIFYKITHEGANFNLIPQGADYDALMPILKKALAKNPAERYQTAYEFAVDLREWLKAHATSASTQHVLESLVSLEEPTHPPLPLTDAPGVTVVPEGGQLGATLEIDRRPPRRGPAGPPRGGARAVVDAGASVTVRPGATRLAPAPPATRAPARPRPAARPSLLPWIAVLLVVGAVAVAGWLAWTSRQAPGTPPPPTQAAAPSATPPPPTTPATPTPSPITPAPAPTFEDAVGKAAASVRTARAAFAAGDYERAVASARAALREDRDNGTALRILDQALVGQKAGAEVRAADSALGQGDLATAEARLGEALRIAPWDAGAVGLARRLEEARLRARREADEIARAARTAQINGLLAEATGAMERKQYEAAIAAYDRVLVLDPGNQAATIGKSNALTVKAVAEAAPAGPRPGPAAHSFTQGRTEARGNEQERLVGFEDSAGVEVKRATQAADLPGKVHFDAAPPAPRPGEGFRVRVFLANEGSQPILLATMTVTTTVDGKRQSNTVPPLVTTVAPAQRALVFQTPGELLWKEGTLSWTMEIVLHTAKGETYRNTLSWK